MAVQGFKISDGTVVKYDYLALDNITTDKTLSIENAAADGKAVGEELTTIKQDLEELQDEIEGGGGGLTAELKAALDQLAQKVAYIDEDGQDYYDALHDALYPPKPATGITLNESSLSFATLNATQQLTATVTPSDTSDTVVWASSDTSVATVSSSGLVTSVAYGSATITATAGNVSATCSVAIEQASLTSISAVYTQSGTVYNTDSLDSLKNDLVVTATWSDSSTSTVSSTDYTLSGTLSVGTSTITVAYGGKTTTFNVTVTEYVLTPLYNWDFTNSMTDTEQSLVATTNGTQSENGLYFGSANKYAEFPGLFSRDRTYAIDIGDYTRASANTYARIFMVDSDSATDNGGSGFIFSGTRKNGDIFYINGSWNSTPIVDATTDPNGEYFKNSTLGFYVDDNGYCSVYKDGTLLGTSGTAFPESLNGKNVYFGSSSSDFLYSLYITGFRVYEGNIY